MSNQITTAFVQQYGANIDLLAQQKDCRFEGKVRMEDQHSETRYFEQVGATDVVEATSRHDDTPLIDTPHDRRQVILRTFRWADLIDNADDVRTLIDPTSTYVQSAVMAMNRKKDDLVIAAATGDAKTGKAGATSVSLPASQKVALGTTNLTIAKMLSSLEIFMSNDVDDDEEKFMVCTGRQITSLLNTTEVKSSDYNTVKALAEGRINSYMGFTFIRSERLPGGSGAVADRTIFSYCKSGILLSKGDKVITRVTERADKNYSVQPFREEYYGATRMEEDKVVQINCKET